MSLPDDFADRLKMVDAFISCPECGSDEATLDCRGIDVDRRGNFRGVCPDCGHQTPWTFGDDNGISEVTA